MTLTFARPGDLSERPAVLQSAPRRSRKTG